MKSLVLFLDDSAQISSTILLVINSWNTSELDVIFFPSFWKTGLAETMLQAFLCVTRDALDCHCIPDLDGKVGLVVHEAVATSCFFLCSSF
jgi:hypothetical protein